MASKTRGSKIKFSIPQALAPAVLTILVAFPILSSSEPDPVALDEFAGQTVTGLDMGLAVMNAREQNCPQVGELAPDFELPVQDSKDTLQLSDMRGGKPVVLIFGSYT